MTISDIHPRREARQCVLEALFAHQYNKDIPSLTIKRAINKNSLREKNKEFIKLLFNFVIDNKDSTDKIIQSHLENWEFERIAQIDRLLIKMGICEIFYINEIPPKVSITEMVEISKTYSTDDSPVFINGILDAVYKNYQMQERE